MATSPPLWTAPGYLHPAFILDYESMPTGTVVATTLPWRVVRHGGMDEVIITTGEIQKVRVNGEYAR